MTTPSSQELESFLPVYDAVPGKWEDARPFIVEQLKKISEAVNVREIGFFLNEQLLSGGQFIPSVNSQGQFRSIFRKVIDLNGLAAGLNADAHGITVNANFTLIHLWVSATKSTAPFQAFTMVYPEVTMNDINVLTTSPGAFDRAFAFIEYILED